LKTAKEILNHYHIHIKEEIGNDYITLCPFHDDKNPSFSVRKESGVYHCWGCGEKGNLVTLVSKLENISTKEAWKKINKKDNLGDSYRIINSFIMDNNKKEKINLDDTYYHIKNLFDVLLYRNNQNKHFRKRLYNVLKNEEDFKPFLERQKLLKQKIAGPNMCIKRNIYDMLTEEYDNSYYHGKRYQNFLKSIIQFPSIKNEWKLISNLISNEKYQKNIMGRSEDIKSWNMMQKDEKFNIVVKELEELLKK
jgi:DNA primase